MEFKKIMKMQKDRIYLQLRELLKSKFQVGAHFSYFVNTKSGKMYIIPSNNAKNTVSVRKLKTFDKPVIDIRDKKSLEVFKEAEYLQISIKKNRIIVEAYAEASSKDIEQGSRSLKNSSTVKRVLEGKETLLRKIAEICMTKKQLKQAAGAEGQLNLFDDVFVQSVSTACQINSKDSAKVISFKKAMKDIPIALQAVSLFSGAGLMDLGFLLEDFEIVFALDFNEFACETYRKNLGNHIVCADITKFPKNKLPKTPVMMAGSPCQGFSNANRFTHFLDNPKNLLVREYIQAVRENENCAVWTLENVPQILTAGNGAFKREIYEAFSDFEVTSGIMTASDFGSAQDRDRAIFIGSKIGKIALPKPNTVVKKTVRQAFEGLHDGIPNQKDFSLPKPDTVERMKHVPQGGNLHDLPKELRTKSTHSNMYRRLAWDGQSITIANIRKAVITHPEKNRILSVRECARIQNLPDEFVFHGTLDAKQQQVANGVDIKISQAVAKVIKDAVEKYNERFNSNVSFGY